MGKKNIAFALFIILAIFVVGCGGSDGSSSSAVAAGEELFNQTVVGETAGCVTCHSLEPDVVIVGPSLAAFAQEAEEEGEVFGMTAEEFVRESVLDPNAIVPEGFPADTMPANWGEILTDEQVDNLVAFLLSLE